MRKRYFYFNNGVDGVVLAKGKKQAVNLLRKLSGLTKPEIRKWLERGYNEDFNSGDYLIIGQSERLFNGRSRVSGFTY